MLTAMTPMIEARGAGRLFGRGPEAPGLLELDLVVPRGHVVALLGHNGAGKTTAVRGLSTLLRFDRGQARVAGFDTRAHPQRVRERIALIGQSVAVDDQLTARENVVLFGRLRGLTRADAAERAGQLLAEFGLVKDADRPVTGFSGGMRRRLDVATSMIVRPELLFVDEPTTGLDPAARRDLWRTLRALVAEGTTILLTTQYLEEADALADHIVLLAHGRVITEGTSDELKDQLGPATLRVRFTGQADVERARRPLQTIDPSFRMTDGVTATLSADRPQSLLECVRSLDELGISPVEVTLRKPSLDEVFLSLTEHHDDEEPT